MDSGKDFADRRSHFAILLFIYVSAFLPRALAIK